MVKLAELIVSVRVKKYICMYFTRIGPSGVRRVVINLASRSMELLDLSWNSMGDEGFKYLADVLFKGAVIKRLFIYLKDRSHIL